jgi:hypothetical protein
LAKEQSFSEQENVGSKRETVSHFEAVATAKKTFVEPELSSPVDVLEATTFFQSATSGVTN